MRQRPASVRNFRLCLEARLADEQGFSRQQLRSTDLVFNLSRLLNRLSQDFESAHRRYGWTWAGFRIMNVLWAQGTVELRDLARLTGSSKASISSAVNTLERNGLVRRSRDCADKRQVRLSLTQQGNTELRKGIPVQSRQERRWFDVLSVVEQQQLAALLARLADQPTPP
jgi:DNA-binding MarR family transcriptional regulator